MVTLRRVTGPSQYTSVRVRAVMSTPAGQSDMLPGGVKQFRQQFIISNKDILAVQWPGEPRRGDQVVTDAGSTSTVQSVDSRKIGDELAMFVLQTTGGP